VKDVLQEIKEVWQESIRYRRNMPPGEGTHGQKGSNNGHWKGGVSMNKKEYDRKRYEAGKNGGPPKPRGPRGPYKKRLK